MAANRKHVHIRYPRSERREISREVQSLAHGRTAHLYRHVEAPLADLLAWAYLQGIEDAARTMFNAEQRYAG